MLLRGKGRKRRSAGDGVQHPLINVDEQMQQLQVDDEMKIEKENGAQKSICSGCSAPHVSTL